MMMSANAKKCGVMVVAPECQCAANGCSVGGAASGLPGGDVAGDVAPCQVNYAEECQWLGVSLGN